jgi:hypothetical protein
MIRAAALLSLLLWGSPLLAQELLVPIHSDPPGAAVMVDGALLCRATPCARHLTPGPHRVQMLLEGHKPQVSDITLFSGARISWRLEQEGALLDIPALPWPATAWIDGAEVGALPLVGRALAPGPHEVSLRSPCYEPWRAAVTARRGERAALAPDPTPREGALMVVTPGAQGVEVWLEGARQGEAPLTITASVCAQAVELRRGEERYRVTARVRERGVELLRLAIEARLLEGQRVYVQAPSGGLSQHEARCLVWPEPSQREAAQAASAARSPLPAGARGTVLGLQPGCDDPDAWAALVEIDGAPRWIAASALSLEPAQGAQRARITNAGSLYSTINSTDCLTWPDAQLRARAGAEAWGADYPANGDEGVVVWTTKHCSSDLTVYVLETRGRYVPINATGVELLGPAPAPQGAAAAPAPALAVGVRAEVVHPGHHYDRLHERECVAWPAPRGVAAAGQGPIPLGARGHVVALSRHCQSGAPVYLLEWEGRFYPFAPEGLKALPDDAR